MFWYDFKSIMDPTTPDDPLLVCSDDKVAFWCLEFEIFVATTPLTKPSKVDGLKDKHEQMGRHHNANSSDFASKKTNIISSKK